MVSSAISDVNSLLVTSAGFTMALASSAMCDVNFSLSKSAVTAMASSDFDAMMFSRAMVDVDFFLRCLLLMIDIFLLRWRVGC